MTAKSRCRRCGVRKAESQFIDLGYCRACGVMPCRACGELKLLAKFAEGQKGEWYCRACGFTVCRSCGLRKPDLAFRDLTLDPTCRDCAVWRLSDQERATLKREERDYRRRVRQGHRHTDGEWHESQERRAALLGISPRQYSDRTMDVGLETLMWYPAYLLSASIVVVFAIGYGVYAVLDGMAVAPPALLSIPVTILILVGWPLIWIRIVEPAPAYDDFALWSRERRIGCFFVVVILGGGLLLPVLSYLLVLAAISAIWP